MHCLCLRMLEQWPHQEQLFKRWWESLPVAPILESLQGTVSVWRRSCVWTCSGSMCAPGIVETGPRTAARWHGLRSRDHSLWEVEKRSCVDAGCCRETRESWNKIDHYLLKALLKALRCSFQFLLESNCYRATPCLKSSASCITLFMRHIQLPWSTAWWGSSTSAGSAAFVTPVLVVCRVLVAELCPRAAKDYIVIKVRHIAILAPWDPLTSFGIL